MCENIKKWKQMKTQPPCCVQGFLVTLWDHLPTFRICSVGTTPFFPHFICACKVFWPVGIGSRSLTSCILKQTNEPKKTHNVKIVISKNVWRLGVRSMSDIIYLSYCTGAHVMWNMDLEYSQVNTQNITKLCQKVSAQAAQPPSLGFNQCKF